MLESQARSHSGSDSQPGQDETAGGLVYAPRTGETGRREARTMDSDRTGVREMRLVVTAADYDEALRFYPVSYTHLTLPTICSV